MAIDLLSNPDEDSVNSVYRPIVFSMEIDDTSGSLELVRATVKLYINGSVVNNNNPIMQDPDLDQTGISGVDKTKFTFDISGVASNYLTSDLQVLGGEADLSAANSLKTLYIVAGGIYKNTSTNELSEATTAIFSADNTIYIINAVWQHQDTQNFSAFELATSSKKFLTNFDTSKKIKIKTDESYFFSCLDLGSSGDTFIKVRTYNSSGATVDLYKIEATNSGKRYDIGVGSSNFANLITGDMHSSNAGTLPIIGATVTSYDVMLEDDSLGVISATYSFDIDRKCHDYSTRIHWLNRLGGFDAWTFDGADGRGQNQKKETYSKNLDFSFSVNDRETSVLAVEANNTFSAWSGLLSENQRKWMEELYTSPEVYVVEGGNYVPIHITNTQIKTVDDFNKLLQVKVDFIYAYENVINV